MTSLNIMPFIYITLIFLFLPSMYLPGGNIPVYDIVIGFTLFVLILNIKKIIKFKTILDNYPIKFLFYYVIWCVISGLILVILNKFNFLNYLYAIFILLIYNNLSWFLLPIITIPNIISIKQIKKILLVGIYLICIYGLLVFIFNSLNINILDPIQDIINNRRENIVTARNLSVFEEPGYFGGFLCINLPLIYKTILSKFKVIKSKTLNFIIKKTYIPIIWITIFTIKSPIWLVFCLIITFVFFSKTILFFLKKYSLYFIIIILLLSIGFTAYLKSIDIEQTFINRVIKTIENIDSMEKLIIAEPSLANRIISYRARLQLLVENPVTGVGYKNSEYVVKKYFCNDNQPLTQETLSNIIDSYSTKGSVGINGAILWDTLSNTGLVGFILLYAFYISCIVVLTKIIKNMNYCSERNFIEGVKYAFMSIVIFSFYDIRLNFVYFWFLFGLTLSFALYKSKINNQFKGNIGK